MLKVLIKNHLKLLFRGKLVIYIGMLFPVFEIIMISLCVSSILVEEIQLGKIIVGVANVKENALLEDLLIYLEQYDIESVKLEEDEGIRQVGEGKLAAYLKGADENDVLYFPEFMTNQSEYVRSCIALYRQYPHHEIQIQSNQSLVVYEKVEVPRPIESKEYYSLVGWASFLWVGAYCAGRMAASEAQGGIEERLRQVQLPSHTVFLGRLLPILMLEAFISGVMFVLIYYSLKIPLTSFSTLLMGIIMLELIAFACFNTCLSFWIHSEQGLIVTVWFIWFILGVLGGNFQDYMHNFIDEKWQKLSPMLNINRCLIEIYQNGTSQYLIPSLLSLVGVIGISIFLGIVRIQVRRRQDANFKNINV